MILSKIGELRGETSARRNTALSSSKVLSTLWANLRDVSICALFAALCKSAGHWHQRCKCHVRSWEMYSLWCFRKGHRVQPPL